MYADDVNILGGSKHRSTSNRNIETLVVSRKEIGTRGLSGYRARRRVAAIRGPVLVAGVMLQ
jgi:hypothetical protein